MQAKGLITFFGIALVIVCIYQLSFTLVSSNVERKAKNYANAKVSLYEQKAGITLSHDTIETIKKKHRRRFLDSMSSEPVLNLGFFKYNFKETQENQLSLGLDLKGGMSMVLEVKVADILKSLAYNTDDATFNAAISQAKANQKTSQKDFLTLFGEAFETLDPNAKLAAIFAPLEEFQDKIDFQSDNGKVISVLREEVNGAVKNTYNVLRTRIDQFGVAQPNISLQENTGRIIVELPGVDDPSRVRKILQQTAQLEFWKTFENQQIGNYFVEANNILRDILKLSDTTDQEVSLLDVSEESNPLSNVDTADANNPLLAQNTGDTSLTDFFPPDTSELEGGEELGDDGFNPLWQVLTPAIQVDNAGNQFFIEGPMVAYVRGRDTARVNEYLKYDRVKAVFPPDLKLLWSAKPINKEEAIYGLYAIQTSQESDQADLTGDVITNATQEFDQYGNPAVGLVMNSYGASTWEKLTEWAMNANIRNRCIAIVLDNRVYSAPRVQSVISGGRSQITGLEDIYESIDLSNILKSGKLEAPARIIEEEVVGPSLGKASVRSGLMSLLIGLVIVMLFMIFYYSNSGIVSNIALLLNLFFIFGALASLGASLTLPGMAGIVLTIGMAVDANVIIFERIREELERGKGIRLALVDGYKNSYSAIIDANVTTLITAAILLTFGLGPIKGFATVLFIGIISSLFTAVVISRLIFDWRLEKGKKISFWTNITAHLFKNTTFHFIDKRKTAYLASALFILLGLSSIFFRGFDLGVDFKGGRRYVVNFEQPIDASKVKQKLTNEMGSSIVKTHGSASQLQITTAYRVDDENPETDNEVQATLFSELKEFLPDDVDYARFIGDNLRSSAKVGASIADDIRQSAIWVVLLGGICIFLYILIRFRKWQFGLGALAAILHDVLIILGIFSLLKSVLPFSLEIDQAFVAALLTVIGYSINDTVVVYDRIREFLNLHPTTPLIQNVNGAINSTLSRTLITSLTTMFVVLILFIFGGEVIRGFSFALLIGIIVGTYSSIFIASPITVDLLNRYGAKEVK